MDKINAKALLISVKANLSRLDSCPGPHDFAPHEPNGPGSGGIFPDMICRTCGGVLGRHEAAWYIRGLQHGARFGGRGFTP